MINLQSFSPHMKTQETLAGSNVALTYSSYTCFGTKVGVEEFDRQVRNSILPTLNKVAMLQAANEGHSDQVQDLLDKKADVDSANGAGHSCLYRAAESGHLEVLRALLAAGASKDIIVLVLYPLSCCWSIRTLLVPVPKHGG